MPFDKKFWITFAALLVVSMVLGFVTHGLILAGDYEALTDFEVIASLELLAYALAFVPIYLIYHTVANFPLDLAIKQILLEGSAAIVLGVTAAFVNK